jgi:hypothetical protein
MLLSKRFQLGPQQLKHQCVLVEQLQQSPQHVEKYNTYLLSISYATVLRNVRLKCLCVKINAAAPHWNFPIVGRWIRIRSFLQKNLVKLKKSCVTPDKHLTFFIIETCQGVASISAGFRIRSFDTDPAF